MKLLHVTFFLPVIQYAFSVSCLIFLLTMKISAQENALRDLTGQYAMPLENPESIDDLISIAGNKKFVFLGESTHGTAEYYLWRDRISRRLIQEQGFSFILVEGDWASIFRLNQYVKGESDYESAVDVVRTFNRWPLWMWRNNQVVELAEWLKTYNLTAEKKTGIYGMDVYDEWQSYEELMRFFEDDLSGRYDQARESLSCMDRFINNSWTYAQFVNRGGRPCTQSLKLAFDLLETLLSQSTELDPYHVFYLLQNARVVKNAEKFYRKAVTDNAASWNSRVQHMFTTLIHLSEFAGVASKGIIWAHNTHIGDASHTIMQQFGQKNIGMLARQHFGKENVLLVGFSAYQGLVTAGSQWGAEMLEMVIPPAVTGSFEQQLYHALKGNYYLVMNENLRNHPVFGETTGHRAIGVIYDPASERQGNYVPSVTGKRYDVIFFFENTHPLDYVE